MEGVCKQGLYNCETNANSEQCMQLSWYVVHASLASSGTLVVSAMNVTVVVKLGQSYNE